MIDLLKPNIEDLYRTNPLQLEKEASALRPGEWIVIDEIQKIPKLLNLVHFLIEEKKIKFALTGSSARKLKRGSANLLAGRAFNYQLYPFIQSELEDNFDLNHTLTWGCLPKIFTLKRNEDKALFLESYVHTYLKEEISAASPKVSWPGTFYFILNILSIWLKFKTSTLLLNSFFVPV